MKHSLPARRAASQTTFGRLPLPTNASVSQAERQTTEMDELRASGGSAIRSRAELLLWKPSAGAWTCLDGGHLGSGSIRHSAMTPCRSPLRGHSFGSAGGAGSRATSSRTDRSGLASSRAPTTTVRRRRSLRRSRGPARRDGVVVAAGSPRASVRGHGRVAVRSRGACGCPVFDFRPASWRGFWTPEARRVLNPHASIGIYGHEPGAGQCVVRMFKRFVAPRRRDRDCLKIVVSPVRFWPSPFCASPANRRLYSRRAGALPSGAPFAARKWRTIRCPLTCANGAGTSSVPERVGRFVRLLSGLERAGVGERSTL
jgi:hypothetical protein